MSLRSSLGVIKYNSKCHTLVATVLTDLMPVQIGSGHTRLPRPMHQYCIEIGLHGMVSYHIKIPYYHSKLSFLVSSTSSTDCLGLRMRLKENIVAKSKERRKHAVTE